MSPAARLIRMHARFLLDAAECEALAARNPDFADAELAEARELRLNAAVLAELVAERHPEVAIPAVGQLALFSDGAP